MVPFAGYSMPLAYGSVGQGTYFKNPSMITSLAYIPCHEVASHKHVRASVGLFDVGHMVQSLCVVNLEALSHRVTDCILIA